MYTEQYDGVVVKTSNSCSQVVGSTLVFDLYTK